MAVPSSSTSKGPKLKPNRKLAKHLKKIKENEVKTCATKIKKQLDEVKNSKQVGSHPSIFEVPSSLRKLHPDAFLPRVVSIGPYHRKLEHLNEMEKLKWRLLQRFIQWTKLPLDFFVKPMLQIEEDTRNCYYKPIEADKQEFVEMMLLDACFIIELLYFDLSDSSRNISESESSGSSLVLRGFIPFIKRDLLMLENQLPFAVVELFFLTFNSSNPSTPENPSTADNKTVENLALKFFNDVIPGISKNLPNRTRNEPQPLHLLDIILRSLEPSPTSLEPSQQQPANRSTCDP